MSLKNIKVCPACYQHNTLEAESCAHCGIALPKLLPSLITEPVPDPAPKPRADSERQAVRFTALYKDIVAFVIEGQEQPVLVKGSQQIVLGRFSFGESAPTIDLTPYNAAERGVSRLHARVTRRDEEYYLLEDLGSTNGTWLNRKRLEAHKPQEMRSGDLIQLGQLMLRVYFRNQRDLQSTEQTIHLHNKLTAPEAILTLNPALLAGSITPYLSALAGLQAIHDKLRSQPITPVRIASIAPDSQSLYLAIRIDGVSDALKLVGGPLADWRTIYFEKVILLLEMRGLLKPMPHRQRSLQSASVNGTSTESIDALTRELRGAEARLGLELLNQIAPMMPEADRRSHLEPLLEHLHVLTFNALQFVQAGD